MADPIHDRAATLKERACRRIDEMAPSLIAVSLRIWETPEVAFEEEQASRWLADLLTAEGYDVELGVGNLPTAFTAQRRGSGAGPTVGLFSEYDALPDLGHGCGHNLLAISGVGAAVGLTAVADELPGTIRIQGTPAEEGPSGKTLLLDAGVFNGLDFAVIFHPWDEAFVLEKMRTGQGISFTFTGKHAHAAAHPELAIDALNGVIALFNNVNLLRQHFRPDVSVTGNIPDGGRHAFPVTAKARFGVRVFEGETDFIELREMIVDCARAAALATRTGLDHRLRDSGARDEVERSADGRDGRQCRSARDRSSQTGDDGRDVRLRQRLPSRSRQPISRPRPGQPVSPPTPRTPSPPVANRKPSKRPSPPPRSRR